MYPRLFSPVLLFALVLAACGGTASAPAAPSSPPPASAAANPSTAALAASASVKPAASAAVPVSASAVAKPAASAAAGAPLKIGILLPFTGPLSVAGKDNQDVITLYLENNNGQLAGRKVELVNADDAADGQVGLTKIRQLVESDKVSLVMGLQSSQVCYAVSGYIRDSKTPAMATADCAAQDLTINPKYASPYLVRTVGTIAQITDPSADWVFKNGFKKAILMTSDFVAGVQFGDLFASAYVARGGTIVQEIHPPLGTQDFGPYLSSLNQEADVLVLFEPGTDGLRLSQQYPTYVPANRKLQIFDMAGQMSNGRQRNDLGATGVGLVASSDYMEAFDTPVNQSFVKLWYSKHPNQPMSQENGYGWSGMQFLEAALKQVNGDISDKDAFLKALHSTQIESVRGPLKLDEFHDTIQNLFIYQYERKGDQLSQKPLQTYPTNQFWDRTKEQVEKFPLGQMKGKWVGMTKDKLGDVITLLKS
ncbi:MAG TPA: ABC transporter substrate-binding protein [Chloroflexota bacterium]|nr:ABC transporter substrate-binding protein [Chloroflexota bacterium]